MNEHNESAAAATGGWKPLNLMTPEQRAAQERQQAAITAIKLPPPESFDRPGLVTFLYLLGWLNLAGAIFSATDQAWFSVGSFFGGAITAFFIAYLTHMLLETRWNAARTASAILRVETLLARADHDRRRPPSL